MYVFIYAHMCVCVCTLYMSVCIRVYVFAYVSNRLSMNACLHTYVRKKMRKSSCRSIYRTIHLAPLPN